MKTIRSDEEAVSPVIGVILMVAIVVILAAVIAAFVFGMAGSTSTTKTVGVIVTIDKDNHGSIIFEGGPDLNKMTGGFNTTVNQTQDVSSTTAPDVGDVFTTTLTIPGERVIIVGNFQDGSSQVIYDRQF